MGRRGVGRRRRGGGAFAFRLVVVFETFGCGGVVTAAAAAVRHSLLPPSFSPRLHKQEITVCVNNATTLMRPHPRALGT
jgi:hypothetical protein